MSEHNEPWAITAPESVTGDNPRPIIDANGIAVIESRSTGYGGETTVDADESVLRRIAAEVLIPDPPSRTFPRTE